MQSEDHNGMSAHILQGMFPVETGEHGKKENVPWTYVNKVFGFQLK